MGPNGEEMETAAIITTDANRTLHHIHHRMPVVIPPQAFDLWLDCANVDALTAAALIVPAPDDLFEAYEISPAVNRVANDVPAVLEPVGLETVAERAQSFVEAPSPMRISKRKKKDDRQTSLF
jgi:putative SOS response-associated peptidase YedK